MEKLQALLPSKLKHHIHFQRIIKVDHKNFQKVDFKHEELSKKPNGKFISLAIFTANLSTAEKNISHIYLMGCLQNVVLHKLLYKDWDVIVYVDASSWTVYPDLYAQYFLPILNFYPEVHVIEVDWRTELPRPVSAKLVSTYGERINKYRDQHGFWDLALVAAQLIDGNNPIQFAKTIWRFFPGGFNVAFISRDTDARINIREEVAMNEWFHSTYAYSRIFDNAGHANPFLAGMWGAKSQCHNILRDYHVYGSCHIGDVPLPKIISQVEEFLSDTQMMLKGYGIDELFLGQLDDVLSKKYYDNVVTYGKGTYYAGSVVFSFFTDRQSLKIGNRMMTLMPAKSPDNVFGEHQTVENFVTKKGDDSIPVLGRECYFVGEDLPIKHTVDKNVIRWLIHWTLNYASAKGSDMSVASLTKQFDQYNIKTSPEKFSRDIHNQSVAKFQESHGFDKRILPHFWYCFLSGTNENIPFFEVYGTFNANEYEIRVFEVANRLAFLKHVSIRNDLLELVNGKMVDDLKPKMVKVFLTGKGKVVSHTGKDVTEFFQNVREYTMQHSAILPYLTAHEKDSYWDELINVYPFSALRQLNLEF